METRTWEPPPEPQRGYVYRWEESVSTCMYVHEATGRSFVTLPPVFPEPWVPVYFHDEAEDYVCQNTDFGGPCQYSRTIPTTPFGWKAAWDPERFDFSFL